MSSASYLPNTPGNPVSLTPPAAETSRLPLHLNHLDGVRALAALYVMLDHTALEVWPVLDGKSFPTGPARWIFNGFTFGHFAVSIFIVISGFCLALPVITNGGQLRGGAQTFFKKRARRILPPYYLAMAFSLILIWLLIGHWTGTHWDVSLPVTLKGVVAHLLLLQDVYSPAQINGVFWSIALEWQIYFVFPLLILLWRRIGAVTTTLITVFLSLVGLQLVKHTFLSGISLQFLGLFALGTLGAAVCYSEETRWARCRERTPWMLFTVGMIAGACLLTYVGKDGYADFFGGLAMLGLLAVAAQPGKNGLRNLLSARPLVFVGTFAYSVYLVHAPLLQVVWQYGLHPLHLGAVPTFCLLALIGGPLIVATAYVFFLTCERPFLNTKSRGQNFL